jgi:predicted transcriptional regulator
LNEEKWGDIGSATLCVQKNKQGKREEKKEPGAKEADSVYIDGMQHTTLLLLSSPSSEREPVTLISVCSVMA